MATVTRLYDGGYLESYTAPDPNTGATALYLQKDTAGGAMSVMEQLQDNQTFDFAGSRTVTAEDVSRGYVEIPVRGSDGAHFLNIRGAL